MQCRRNFLKSCGILLGGYFVTAILIVACTLILPLQLIWRWLIFRVYKSLGGNAVRMLSPVELLLWKGKNCTATVLELESQVTVGDVAVLFSGIAGEYPELRCSVKNLCGVHVFKLIDDFHVIDHLGEVPGDLSIAGVHEWLLNREFQERNSGWEVLLFNRGKVIGLRMKGCMGDARSILKLFVNRVGGKQLVSSVSKDQSYLRWNWRVGYEIGVEWMRYWRQAVLGAKEFQVSKQGKRIVGLGELVGFESVKVAGKEADVSGSCVIIAGVLGGLSKYLNNELKEDLKTIKFGYSLPVSSNRDRSLSNSSWTPSYATTTLEQGLVSPSKQSLQIFSAIMEQLKDPSRCLLLRSLIHTSGSLVWPFSKLLLGNRVCGVGIMNIAGDEEGFYVENRECVGFSMSSGGIENIGLMVSVLCYRKAFRVVCVADEQILNRHSLDILIEYIDREFLEIFWGLDDTVV